MHGMLDGLLESFLCIDPMPVLIYAHTDHSELLGHWEPYKWLAERMVAD